MGFLLDETLINPATHPRAPKLGTAGLAAKKLAHGRAVIAKPWRQAKSRHPIRFGPLPERVN
jgi:hypothetical protein